MHFRYATTYTTFVQAQENPWAWACVSTRNNNANACEPLFPTILSTCLPSQVGANIGEEQLVSIAERTIMEADVDKDNLISFEEFKKVLERTDVEQKMSIRFLS